MRSAVLAHAITAAAVLVCASCANLKFWDRGDSLPEDPPAVSDAAPAAENVSVEPAPGQPSPAPPGVINDGLRLPDNMLSLPSEREFRRPPPEATPAGNTGVTARPPE